MMEGKMIAAFADPFDALFNLQRALEGRLASDWLHDQTTSQGPFPPINVFQQGDDILAIIELPGIEKDGLTVQAKENTIRIAGKKSITFPDGVSVHRRERVSGEFDRTLSLPVQLDPDRHKSRIPRWYPCGLNHPGGNLTGSFDHLVGAQ
jgi:HSP20 family protein